MYPNFCFSKTNHENLLRMKTQQCPKDAKICNCKEATCTKMSTKKMKNMKRQEGGSILRDKCATKRSSKTSHTNYRSNSPSETTKPSVTFQLNDRQKKCNCSRNCNETAQNCEREWERERELDRDRDRGRDRDRDREYGSKRVRQRQQEYDFERNRHCERNRKSDINFEHANERSSQREHLLQSSEYDKNEEMHNDDAFDLNKQLQDSCAGFLNIIHDNVLETVQSTVEKMLVKYYEQTMIKIETLTMQVEGNASLLNKAYLDLLEKIMEQNENSANQFKFVAQMLIDQQQQQMNLQNFYLQSGTENKNVYQVNTQHAASDDANAQNSTADGQQQPSQSEQQETQTMPGSEQERDPLKQQQQQQHHVQVEQHTNSPPSLPPSLPPMAYQYHNLFYADKTTPTSHLDMAYQNYLMFQNSNMRSHNHNYFNCNCQPKMHNSKKPTSLCQRTRLDAMTTSATRSCRRLAKGFSSPSLPSIFQTKVKLRTKAAPCAMAAAHCMPSLTKVSAQHFLMSHQNDLRCNSCTNAIGMRKTISMKTNPSLNSSVFTQSTTHI